VLGCRWTLEEKRRIVSESYGGCREVSATARRHGLSGSQLFTWRRLAREGRLGDEVAALVPVEIGAPVADSPTKIEERGHDAIVTFTSKSAGLIVIEVGKGHPIRVDRDFGAEALGRVILWSKDGLKWTIVEAVMDRSLKADAFTVRVDETKDTGQ
jgi:transposase